MEGFNQDSNVSMLFDMCKYVLIVSDAKGFEL